jgi:hypothetical protein
MQYRVRIPTYRFGYPNSHHASILARDSMMTMRDTALIAAETSAVRRRLLSQAVTKRSGRMVSPSARCSSSPPSLGYRPRPSAAYGLEEDNE